MSTNRLVQLAKIKSLHALRVQEALTQLQEQQRNVAVLKAKVQNIQDCAQLLVEQLISLDKHRLQADRLTVDLLQEEAASRAIVQRDLRKEQLYLETATNDVNEAVAVLTQKHAQWHERSQRLDALTALTHDQQKIAMRRAQLRLDREMDDQAISRHRV